MFQVKVSITAGEQYPLSGRFACHHTYAGCLVGIERDATYGSLSLLLDFSLGLGSAVPVCHDEYAIFDSLLELIVCVDGDGFLDAAVKGFLIQTFLYVVENLYDMVGDAVERNNLFLQCVAAHHFDRALFQISLSDGQTYRNALDFIVSEFESRAPVVSVVILDAYAFGT